MRRKPFNRQPIAEINVVPYIDVMLVLLIIFMITTPMLTQGVKIQLPKTAAKSLPQADTQPIIVTVDKAGNYYLNIADKPLEALSPVIIGNRVAAALQVAAQANTTRQVMVKGDANVNYGAVVAAMSLLQQAGAKTVGLVTEPPTQSV